MASLGLAGLDVEAVSLGEGSSLGQGALLPAGARLERGAIAAPGALLPKARRLAHKRSTDGVAGPRPWQAAGLSRPACLEWAAFALHALCRSDMLPHKPAPATPQGQAVPAGGYVEGAPASVAEQEAGGAPEAQGLPEELRRGLLADARLPPGLLFLPEGGR